MCASLHSAVSACLQYFSASAFSRLLLLLLLLICSTAASLCCVLAVMLASTCCPRCSGCDSAECVGAVLMVVRLRWLMLLLEE